MIATTRDHQHPDMDREGTKGPSLPEELHGGQMKMETLYVDAATAKVPMLL